MDPARWERVQALFFETVDLTDEARRARLAAACAVDPALADEVLALVQADAHGDTRIDGGLASWADRLIEDDARDATPRRIGPYRLLAVLGEGGMGVVYLAERDDLGSQVAIKVLRDAWLSPARRERFTLEQRTLAQLNHPCIARLYDADVLPDGTPWFAMEFVDGVPITDYCRAHALGPRRILALFRGVCEAVLHAHRQAVIHRDLKPSNILVTRGGQPKLLDFGIAKQIAGPPTDWTRAELRLMTPAYAAPEQLTGSGQGVHTDVYALGALLYELLAGRPPFDVAGRTPAEVAELITERAPERPSAVAAGRAGLGRSEWADLDVLCLVALQKDPARRYRSVESLVRDVDHFLRGEPLEARPDSVRYRTGKFLRRRWRPVLAVAAVLLALVVTVTFYTLRLSTARNAAVAEARRARRIQEFMNGLFEGGDPEAGPSDSLRVVDLLERGIRDARGLAADPKLLAGLDQTLGGIYQNLGEFTRADSLLGAAIAARDTAAHGLDADGVQSLLMLAVLRADQSRLDEAERLARLGLAHAARLRPADPLLVARAQTVVGKVLEDRGDYAPAIATLALAVRADSTAGADPGDLSAALTELANSHFYAGHYAVSDSLNRRVLALDRARLGDRHPDVASDWINIGAVQQEWGHWPAAERAYRAALDIDRGWYGEDHYETAAALTMVGRALVQEGNPAAARGPLMEALSVRERIYGPAHPLVASTLNEIGMLAQSEGRLADAEAAFRRMIAIDRQAYHDHHYLIGLGESNLGSLLTDAGRYDAAEQSFVDALRMYGATLPPDHLYFGITRVKRGRNLLRWGRPAAGLVETRGGLALLTGRAEAPTKWVTNGRADLRAEAAALGHPADTTLATAQLPAPVARKNP